MKLGKFIRLEYTGTLDNGDVFDSTDPSVVEGAFGSTTIILGAGHVIKGLEKAVLEMKIGESRELDIPPEDGFGTRDSKKIKLYAARVFKKDKIMPYPGLRVTVEGKLATVKSVSSGRVVVDFNHPLSGLKLHYKVKMVEEVTNQKEQIAELLKFHFGREIDFKIKEGELTMTNVPEYAQNKLQEELATYTAFKNPRFVVLAGEIDEKHNQGGGEKSKEKSKK
ncbi:MAG: peptidylprolyl isomerase [Candidatus Altiarchaeota archaeon]|nr:peptidylprolyl isomerase [Candidatus Altiarchaeota archaeon]